MTEPTEAELSDWWENALRDDERDSIRAWLVNSGATDMPEGVWDLLEDSPMGERPVYKAGWTPEETSHVDWTDFVSDELRRVIDPA